MNRCRRILLTLMAAVALCLGLTACLSPKYRKASQRTPAAVPLNARFQQPPLELTLVTVIVYDGPGSWKRRAFWDEYVVALKNQSAEPVTVVSIVLLGADKVPHAPGTNPWVLERQSKSLERKYLEAGLAFARNAAPPVVIGATGAAVMVASGGIFSASAATVANLTVAAIPLYYGTVLTIDHYNKRDLEAEFRRRRLELPLALSPGETRYGSLFFPMVPNPRDLTVRRDAANASELRVPLDLLQGMHLRPNHRRGNPTVPPVSSQVPRTVHRTPSAGEPAAGTASLVATSPPESARLR